LIGKAARCFYNPEIVQNSSCTHARIARAPAYSYLLPDTIDRQVMPQFSTLSAEPHRFSAARLLQWLLLAVAAVFNGTWSDPIRTSAYDYESITLSKLPSEIHCKIPSHNSRLPEHRWLQR
jgi:hypothetical protein